MKRLVTALNMAFGALVLGSPFIVAFGWNAIAPYVWPVLAIVTVVTTGAVAVAIVLGVQEVPDRSHLDNLARDVRTRDGGPF